MYVDETKKSEDVKDELEEEIENKVLEDIEEELSEEVIVEEKLVDEELSLMRDQFVRLQADFQNYRRRAENEKSEYVALGVKKIACELLNIVDNFERAMDSWDDKDSGLFKGIEMIETQLMDLLKNNYVLEIDAKGKEFDPNFHHAVLLEKVEGVQSGIIIEVLQKGYLIKDKVLRPAMVKVSE